MRFHEEPAVRSLAACRLDAVELDRILVVLNHAGNALDVELEVRHQDTRHVCGGCRLSAPPQGIREAPIAREQEQAAIAGLHRIDHEPSRPAHAWQRFHDRFHVGVVGALVRSRRDRLPLGLVIDQHLRRRCDLESRGHVFAIDDDAIPALIPLTGLRGTIVDEDTTLEHPLLDLAARTESVLREKFMKAFRHAERQADVMRRGSSDSLRVYESRTRRYSRSGSRTSNEPPSSVEATIVGDASPSSSSASDSGSSSAAPSASNSASSEPSTSAVASASLCDDSACSTSGLSPSSPLACCPSAAGSSS